MTYEMTPHVRAAIEREVGEEYLAALDAVPMTVEQRDAILSATEHVYRRFLRSGLELGEHHAANERFIGQLEGLPGFQQAPRDTPGTGMLDRLSHRRR